MTINLDMTLYPELKPGDIVGVRNKTIIGRLMKWAIRPSTDLFHFFLIGDYLPWDGDYVILESIGKGIAVGRLSFYDPADLTIFRRVLPNDYPHKIYNLEADATREKAAAALTRVGRSRYDWLLLIQTAIAALGLLLRGKLPPWFPYQFPYGRNKAYICTEAVVAAWRAVGFPIVEEDIMPMPSAIIMAVWSGRLEQIYPGGISGS